MKDKGVFISYRRELGSDAARICQLYLSTIGMDVFLDVDDNRNGHFDTKILGEIGKRKSFLLICSPGCFDRCIDRDDWLIREIAHALRLKLNIVPVVLDGFQWPSKDSLPSNIREILRHNDFQYSHKLFKSNCKILATRLLADPVPESFATEPVTPELRSPTLVVPDVKVDVPNGLRIGTIDDIIEWGWNGIKLLDEFIRLDYDTLPGLSASHEGDSAQWGPVFMSYPETWRMLFSDPKCLHGYWHFAPLFPSDYELAKNGKLLDSEITIDNIQLFDLPGHYKIYFVQICLQPQLRRGNSTALLFDAVFELLEDLSKRQIFIEELCANAYTPEGLRVCKHFDLLYQCEHADHGTIYAAPIKSVLLSRMASSRPNLIGRYRDAGLI